MFKLMISSCLLLMAVSTYSQNIGGIEDEGIAENIPTIHALNLPAATAIMDSVSIIPYYNESMTGFFECQVFLLYGMHGWNLT